MQCVKPAQDEFINNEDFIQHNKYFIEASLTVDIFHKAEWNTEHILVGTVENKLI